MEGNFKKGAWLSADLMNEMKEYIENVAVRLDGEFGKGRSLKEIILDDNMPELYKKICKLM